MINDVIAHGCSRRAVLQRAAALGAGTAAWAAGTANLRAAAPARPVVRAAAPGVGEDLTSLGPDAVGALLDLVGKYPVVALGEAHGLQEEHDFLAALLRHPDFPARVNDVIVEFGNALYQDVVDRYLAGEPVDRAELRRAWRNTTQSPLQQWDSPVYEQFFATVRDVNRILPEERRIRVHLGDPPVDWVKVQSRNDLEPFWLERDSHFAEVVETAVLAKGRPALLVAGAIHLLRRSPSNPAGSGGTVVELVERRHPGATFVVAPHLGFEDQTCELEARLAAWPAPALTPVAGTWLGELDPALVFELNMVGPDGQVVDPFAESMLGDLIDAYLYLGPLADLSVAVESPFIYRDEAYFEELKRRHALMGHALDEDEPHFFRYGVPAHLLREAPSGLVDGQPPEPAATPASHD